MRRVLETCCEMDEFARDAYATLAASVTDDALAERFRRMERDESEHLAWWDELVKAWDNGLLPDIVTEPEALLHKLQAMLAEMRDLLPASPATLSAEQALTVATKLEFYMLDPCFGEFLDLMEPAIANRRHEQYAEHIERLIGGIEAYYEPGSLASFLAGLLRRTWRDNRLLATYAMRDPLTGLHNRRAFNAHLKQWTAWAARYGRPLSVLLVDVDNFKRVNDTRGHTVGDYALISIADALQRSVRSSDLVARYGGDEFAILAPETDQELLWQLSDRVLKTVRETPMSEGSDVRVTVSIGSVVTSDRAGVPPRRLEELLTAADQALYSAKEMGRDRAAPPVVLAKV